MGHVPVFAEKIIVEVEASLSSQYDVWFWAFSVENRQMSSRLVLVQCMPHHVGMIVVTDVDRNSLSYRFEFTDSHAVVVYACRAD